MTDIVAECDAFVADATAPFEPRFPQRRRTQPEQFSPSKGWSDYECGRVGSRHDRTREVSYEESRQNEAELTTALEREGAARERLEERQRELERVARQLQGIVDQASGELNRQAVSTLQQALLELLEQEHDPDPPADESGEPGASGAPGASGEPEASGESGASVLFESAARVNGTVGRAVLGAEVLLWGEEGTLEPTVRVDLAAVANVCEVGNSLETVGYVGYVTENVSSPAAG